MANSKQEEIVKTLICLADSLDHENKLELAEEVDKALKSLAAESQPTEMSPSIKEISIPAKEFEKLTNSKIAMMFKVFAAYAENENVKIELWSDDHQLNALAKPAYMGSMNLGPLKDMPELAKKFGFLYKEESAKDELLVSEAARPRAPLKGLDDAVKENLIKFLIETRDNLARSVTNIEEFFRRLKYFGVDNTIRDLGLDKMLIGLKDVHSESEESVKRFYELTRGRKMKQNELVPKVEPEQNAMDFFKANEPAKEKTMLGNDNPDLIEYHAKKELTEKECKDCGHEWIYHKSQPNGSLACSHHGCGCKDVFLPTNEDITLEDGLPEDASPQDLKEFWMELDYDANKKGI